MIRASTSLQPLDLSSQQPPSSWYDWVTYPWRRFQDWIHPHRRDLDKIKFTPRSYTTEFEKLFVDQRDSSFMLAFLERALKLLPLDTVMSSKYFWTDRNIDYVCESLKDETDKFQVLLRLTPPEYYIQYPLHCKTTLQVELMLDRAFEDDQKLKDITDAVLIAIGDERNTDELNQLLYYYLMLLTQKKKSDQFIAERLCAQWPKLEEVQIKALQKIENAPHIQKVIAENLSRS